jgi:hypothetical protein
MHLYRSDSCPAGLGRYSDSGFAWRYYLEPAHQFRATNNLLEHISTIITPWVNIIWGRLHSGAFALSMTDSTTLEGWLRKTNFSKLNDDPIQATVRVEVARLHAMHYINFGIREYSQWFLGKANVAANSFSCDDNRMDAELTTLFCIHCPSQILEHFKIQPLPRKLTSWLSALLLRLPVKAQLREKHARTRLGCGNDGPHTAAGLDSPTHSLVTSHATQGSNYSKHLPWLCGKLGFSIKSSIAHVCQTFCEHGRPNPSLDNEDKPGFLLQWELKAFKKEDTAKNHQKAISMSVISTLAKQQISNLN